MTAQMVERLILDGGEKWMTYCPPLPYLHPRLRGLSAEEIDARFKAAEQAAERKGEYSRLCAIVGSTACWRQYVGTWEIRDGQFYLRSVEGCFELTGDEPLLADWFTGVLRVPQGARLKYVHMGFGSVYEQEIHIRIERGLVTGRRVIDNRCKTFDVDALGLANLPGGENRFPGDSDDFG